MQAEHIYIDIIVGIDVRINATIVKQWCIIVFNFVLFCFVLVWLKQTVEKRF